MSRIRFGFRNVFNKSYKIDQFDFLLENIDEFNTPYTGLDIWNTNDTSKKILQVEKRVEYFIL